jgi:hypothetical protein
MLVETMEQIRVPRPHGERPRTRPDRLLADKGYPSRANRAYLAAHRITTTFPDRADQHHNRTRTRRSGGRPPAFDTQMYKRRNVVNAASTGSNNGAGSRCDPTRPPATTTRDHWPPR